MKDKELFSSSPSVRSKRILYTPSSFARTSLLHLQEVGTLQAVRPHTRTDRSPGSHETVYIVQKRRNHKIKPFQTSCRTHKISMIKSEHDCFTALRIENIRKMFLHSPVQII